MKLFRIYKELVQEMAKTPQTAQQAKRLSKVLVPNKKTAEAAADRFWQYFLKFEDGSGLRIPEGPTDQFVQIKQVEGEPWLVWHSVATLSVQAFQGIHLNIFVTTMDAPGRYRMDIVLMGMAKGPTREVRKEFTSSIRKAQTELQGMISEDEKEEFGRIKASVKQVPQEFRQGIRESDNLIGRLLLDNVPIEKLWERAGELQYAVIEAAKLVVKKKSELTQSK